MIHQALLDALLYLYPLPPSTSVELKAPNVTRKILQALSALSMVIDAFGGVSSTDGSGAGSSFPELKKVFYMAIDIMAVDAPASEWLVQELIIDSEQGLDELLSPERQRTHCIYFLCLKLPLLIRKRNAHLSWRVSSNSYPSSTIGRCRPMWSLFANRTFPYLLPRSHPPSFPSLSRHLTDSSLRETFEASHSVMLSIFAAHADKAANDTCPNPDARTARNSVFIRRLVPGYCQYLLEV